MQMRQAAIELYDLSSYKDLMASFRDAEKAISQTVENRKFLNLQPERTV